MPTTPRILIVGAGIAGLSLRLALRDGPWQVRLVERDPPDAGPAAGGERAGAGLAVQPNAMRALHRLGAATAVERAGATIPRFEYRDQHGELLCWIDLDRLWAGVGSFVGIARDALIDALRGDFASDPESVAVAAVRQLGSSVQVWFDDGTTGEYDLVVGADGIHSTVRRWVIDGPGPVHTGQTAWRSLAPTRPDGLGEVQFWLGTDRFFGLCPVGGGATYGFGNVAGPAGREPVAGRRRRLIDLFADFGRPVREYLAAVDSDDDIHCGPVDWLPRVAWRRDQVLLIGDAAHAMSPMMGQGACLAIEDALVLAAELRTAASAADLSAALVAFVARRQARVAWVRAQSEALGELVRLPVGIRDRALREHGVDAFHDRYRPLLAEP